MRDLISTEWLANHLSDPDICILDCSWHMPAAKRSAKAEFDFLHIPGAQFFDLDAISDTESKLPHMMPSAEKFGFEVGKLGAGGSTVPVKLATALSPARRPQFRCSGPKCGQV